MTNEVSVFPTITTLKTTVEPDFLWLIRFARMLSAKINPTDKKDLNNAFAVQSLAGQSGSFVFFSFGNAALVSAPLQ